MFRKKWVFYFGIMVCFVMWGNLSIAAEQGFLLGEEGKGGTVKAAENTDLNIRIRLQPRFDAGDLIKSDEMNANCNASPDGNDPYRSTAHPFPNRLTLLDTTSTYPYG